MDFTLWVTLTTETTADWGEFRKCGHQQTQEMMQRHGGR
jgi:hypothetical protein